MDGLLILVCAVLAWLFVRGSQASTDVSAGWADYENDTSVGDVVTGGTNSIAQAIARFEGFFKTGTLSQRTNNPGDIGTWGSRVANYPTPDAGFAALDGYINSHATANPDWDFYDFFRYYLTGSTTGTPGPHQDPDGYAEYVAQQVGVDPTTPLSQVIG